tara:strand:+ start:524 stop:769 length:246 start_codon:yes stop_codon:yes gene_type:complete
MGICMSCTSEITKLKNNHIEEMKEKDEIIEDMQKIIDQLQDELHGYNEHHNLEIANYKSSIKRLSDTNKKIFPDTSFSHHE